MATALLAVLVAGCGASPEPTSSSESPSTTSTSPTTTESAYPSSIVVLGHSGATGANSDNRGVDVRTNSWATGTNPDVNSIYLRLLALNPAIEGHNTNLAKDGSRVDDLIRQATEALELDPLPELFLIQSVDNDIRCDGTDDENYGPFAATLVSVLDLITTGAPDADVFIVSSPPGTVQNYVDVIKDTPPAWHALAGDEPCDLFDESGAVLTDHVAQQEAIIERYLDQVAASCAQFPACRYDGGANLHTVIELDDLSSDYAHLSITGQAGFAEVTWDAMALT